MRDAMVSAVNNGAIQYEYIQRRVRILFLNVPGIYREGLEPRLRDLTEEVIITGSSVIANAGEMLETGCFDLVIVDATSLLLESVRSISDVAVSTSTRLILIVDSDGSDYRRELSSLKISGLIRRSESAEVLAKIVFAVLSQGRSHQDGTKFTERRQRSTGLTPRQLEVLQALVTGASNKQIARELTVSEHTVKVHLKMIYRLLGVKNRTEAVRKALTLKLTKE